MRSAPRRSFLALALCGFALAPEARAAQLKRVQSSSFTMASGATLTTATLNPPIDPTKSFLVFGVEENASPPVDGQISGQITNATTITFQRAAGNAGNIRVTWWVTEFASGVRVLRGNSTLGPASPGDTTAPLVPAVDPRRSFPLISLRTSGSSYESSDFARAEITGGGTTLSLFLSNGVNSPVAEWQVVEYTDAEVQSGTVTLTNLEASEPVALPNAVNTAKSWLVYSYECRPMADCVGGPPGSMGSRLVRGLVTNGTTLTFDRNLLPTTNEVLNVTWYLVSFTDATTVQHSSASFALGNNQVDIPITPVSRGGAIALAGGAYQRGGRSPYTGDDDHADVAWFAADMTGNLTTLNNLRFNRGFTGAEADVGWFVVDFACCAPLSTVDPGSTLTVTAPDFFELRFNTGTGGGIDRLFDLAVDPTRAWDLAGGTASVETLVHSSFRVGGVYYTDSDFARGKLDLLEATPVRVKARRATRFQDLGGPTVLPGIELTEDYTVSPMGRLGVRSRIETTGTVNYTEHVYGPGVGYSSTGGNPLNAWASYHDAGGGFNELTGGSNFLLFKNDTSQVTTDVLQVLSEDWDSPPHWQDADESHRVPWGPEGWLLLDWRHIPAAVSFPAGAVDTWHSLVHFKPVTLGATASPWLDPAVTQRSADYRAPDGLVINLGKGSRWADDAENTPAGAPTDFFNEAETAYVLDMDPLLGLDFDMSGLGTPRHTPFFKIRRWRSFSEAPVVTLEGASLQNGLEYKAAVKPLSRAHKANALSWHHTGQTDVAPVDVGTGGGVVLGGGAIVSARYGNGLSVATGSNNSYYFAPAADFSFSVGAIEFWYQPFYASTTAGPRMLFFNTGGAGSDRDCFWLEHAGGNLVLRAYVSADNENCNTGGTPRFNIVATGTDYAWRANDWVHIRAEWDSNSYMRLLVDGRLVGSAGGYNVVGWDVGQTRIGSCQITCPGGAGSSNADGVIDEPHIYFGMGASGNPETLAWAGLTSDSRESLASPASNVALLSSNVGPGSKGEYLYLGADSRFRGLNMAFVTPGGGVAPGALSWQYWRVGGGFEGWADLEAVTGFADRTADFTKNGNLQWDADPPDWQKYSVNGGPDLYYVRVHLSGLVPYSPSPVEALVKTDILLFQYCRDVTTAAQTFAFVAPVPTAVTLESFTATPGDGSVLLSWRTASELSNLGFHLYRSPSADGPYSRITPSLIPGLGSSPTGQGYSYRDAGLENGRTYYYELEDVETTGTTERHGPVSAMPSVGAGGGGGEGGSGAGAGGGTDGPGSGEGGGRITYGDPGGTSLREVERGSSYVVLELSTPGFTALPDKEGLLRIEIPGFEVEASPGALSVPVRRALVEALAARGVRLGAVRAEDVVSYDGLRLAAAGTREVEVSADGTVKGVSRPRRLKESHRRGGLVPRLWARLVGSLFQGETKKAHIELSPLRHDPVTGQTVLARRLTVRVEFVGVEGAERSLGGARGRRPPTGFSTSKGVAAHLVVQGPGLYAVRFEDVFAGQRGVAARQLRLSRRGQSVPYHLEPDRSLFGPGSRFFFLSEGSDLNPRGDTVYELELGRTALRMEVASGTPSGASTTEYLKTLRFEQNRFYQSALLGAPDLWLWDLLVSPVTKTYPFTVDALSPSSTASRLRVVLQGASDFPEMDDHHLRITLNGIPAGDVVWDGKTEQVVETEVSPGVLREGSNTLSLENVGDAGAANSMVFLNRFEVSYPRRLVAENGTLRGRIVEGGQVEIAGLTGTGFVVNDAASPVWLRGPVATPGGLAFRGEAGQSYLAASETALRVPEVRRPSSSRLKTSSNQARWVLIAPREFLPAAEPLLDLRRGQGLSVKAVAIEDVYSEFGFGEARPEAIHGFLSYAFHHWKTPPRYVVLLGDSTYDPKDYLGTHVQDRIPSALLETSFLWTVSDPSLAAVNGDDLVPDLAIGRLSAGSHAEAVRLVEKLVAFEEAGRSLEGKAVLVADNADLAGNFEADQDQIAQNVLGAREVEKIYLRDLGASTRATIKAALDNGPGLLSYVGHGATAVWASENVWNNTDIASLDPQPQQPLLLTLNCLNGFFHFPPFDSLAEAFVKAEGKGAIAAFSPSGLSINDAAHLFHQALLEEIEAGTHQRIGDALLAAQDAYADEGAFPELLSIYHLFGDPAMKIR